MKNKCAFKTIELILYTLLLGIAASFAHFAYNLSGENLIVGFFTPVNESVWEHLKLMFFPLLLWWIAIYRLKSKKSATPTNTWIVSAAISLIVAPISVVFLFYSYTGALGIESVLIDILLTYICCFIALWISNHFLNHSTPNKFAAIISCIVVAIIMMSFILFTLNPPELPIFQV